MKKILFLFVVALAALQVSAADVTTAQAQAAASTFLKKQVNAGRLKASAASNLQLVKAEASVAKPTAVDYYIFNTAKSYVVVAGDDQAPQILMYGEEGQLELDNIPPGMQWLLNKYKYQIDGIKAGTMAPVKIPKFATTPVAPLVTANWDQTAPYYNHTPTSGSTHTYTGCPATSLSMCFYKYKWPETYPALPAISASSYGVAAAALSEKAADWANIIDEYTGPTNYTYTSAQADAVAWLMRYVGQACQMQYSTSGSGANDPEIHQACITMGYTDAQLLTLCELVSSGYSYTNGTANYTDAQWNEWMLNELQNGRPIEYLAYDVSGYSVSGHAFNVFGVNASGQYYVNWGWSGDSNGYCTLHNFTTSTGATGQSGSYTFKYGEAMIIGIEPPAGATTTPKISVNPSTLTMSTTVGTPVTSTFTVTGANLTSNVTLSKSGDNAFSLSTSSISATQAENGVTVTVTYNPTAAGSHEATVTLASTDAESVTVKLNGTADPTPLETYAPVMLDASNVTSTSFTASWTDQTPAANVENYTLYVSAEPFKPAIALLDSLDGSKYTGSYANITLSAPWGGTSVKGGNGAVYTSGSSGKITYTIPAGYQNATFSFQVTTTSTNYGSGNITVGSTQTSAVGYSMAAGETHTWVVTASAGETITLTSTDASYSPDIAMIRVYSGNTTVSSFKMAETGDATYRVITGITSKSYTVNNLTEGGTFYFYVVANYTNTTIGTSNTKQVTLLENTNPVITVNPSALDMTATTGETATATFTVGGVNLTGNVTLALDDANGVYSITPTTISAADAMNGVDVTVTYAPTTFGTQTATITLNSADAEDVTVTLNGTATLAKFTPVMLAAIEDYINLTQFRADWTDATPEANVASYTLEVTPKPTEPETPDPVLLEDADFSSLTAQMNTSGQYTNQVSYASSFLPDGWTATTGLFIDDGSIITGALTQSGSTYTFTLASKTYDLTGYDKVTVVFDASIFSSTYGTDITLNVATSAGSQNVTFSGTDFTTLTVVLDCAESDNVTFTGVSGLCNISDIKIYAGDINAAYTLFLVQETGDENSRLITGITDKFYTVENLTAEGTFLYRVKAVYQDGTESDWSNIEEVTLFANEHPYRNGDVNHDGRVDIDDVTALINCVLGNANDACPVCADVNGDQSIDIDDVTALINTVLGVNTNLKAANPVKQLLFVM